MINIIYVNIYIIMYTLYTIINAVLHRQRACGLCRYFKLMTKKLMTMTGSASPRRTTILPAFTQVRSFALALVRVGTAYASNDKNSFTYKLVVISIEKTSLAVRSRFLRFLLSYHIRSM